MIKFPICPLAPSAILRFIKHLSLEIQKFLATNIAHNPGQRHDNPLIYQKMINSARFSQHTQMIIFENIKHLAENR
jgi:hypothetical protein